ncbi:MAG: Asp23/Gls24 family envelope stress response protein [Anaerovoracaceae bacterium]
MDDFNLTYEEQKNSDKMSEDVIAIFVANSVTKLPEVAGLAGGIGNEIQKNILKKDSPTKGIKVSKDDKGYVIDIHLFVEYGAKIPALAWDVQTAVKKKIETMTKKELSAVNVHIEGVKAVNQEANVELKEGVNND